VQWYTNPAENIRKAKERAREAIKTGNSSGLTALEQAFYQRFLQNQKV
jgi:hypothetical protein|tara:strand:+ start:488 stop:631 length:144 start_codon:yes stop_codon:yes gene_type:complete